MMLSEMEFMYGLYALRECRCAPRDRSKSQLLFRNTEDALVCFAKDKVFGRRRKV